MKILDFLKKSNIKELNEDPDGLLQSQKDMIDDIVFDDAEPEIKKKKNKKITNQSEVEAPHYIGHRARLKEKFLSIDSAKFKDYELLEILLTFSIPRGDVKPIAKKLFENFRNFSNIFCSDLDSIKGIKGIGPSTAIFLKLIHEIGCRLAKEEISEDIKLNCPEKVLKYCKLRMSGLNYEQFRVIFLDRKNKLISDEVIQSGTIDKAVVFPREIVKRALEIGAGALILIHNHPSGDPTPSKADIDATINIQKASKTMEIFLYDHLIIGKNSHFSMRANQLI